MKSNPSQQNFNAIVDANGSSIFRMCKAYLGASEEVHDLYQEVLVNVWHALPGFREQSKLSTWIYRITVNTAITYQQKKKRLDQRFSAIDDHQGLSYDDSGYGEKMATENQLKVMMRLIESLEKDQRIVIGLYLEDLSYKEIASVIGKDTNYVGVKIKRIKEKLSKMMQHERIE